MKKKEKVVPLATLVEIAPHIVSSDSNFSQHVHLKSIAKTIS